MSDRLGQRVLHRFNTDLGIGLIVAVEGRELLVEFPAADTVLRLSAENDALRPLEFPSGSRATLDPDDEVVIVDAPLGDGTIRLEDGRVVGENLLWPSLADQSIPTRGASLCECGIGAPPVFPRCSRPVASSSR